MPKIIENLQDSILESANEILLEHGFGDFSIRSVAKKLGIAPATIYNYYPSKESILEALVDRACHKLMDIIERETAAIDDPVAALNRIYELIQSSIHPMFSHWLTPQSAIMPPDHPDGQEIMSRKHEISLELTKSIAAVLEKFGLDASYASVYTRLFIMCSHSRQLTFSEIISAINALQK